jgi:acyl carrier protein
MTQDQFLELLISWIRANKQGSENLDISADTELLGSGLLDSFDFLDLIVYIEGKMGRKIDLSAADPREFSVVRGLCNLVVSSGIGGVGSQAEAKKQSRFAGGDLSEFT